MELIKVKKLLESGGNIFELPFRVVYYARVSTEKDEQLNSLQNQTEYYEKYIKENKSWIFSGGYIDEGVSGTSVNRRDSFLRMVNDAAEDKFDLIITKEISRFSRNTLDSIKYTRKLLSYGVGVYFQNDNINTLTGDAELRLTIMASIAQDEVRRLSERVRFGFKQAQERGVVLGQNNIYGYDKKDGKLTVIREEADVIREIFTRYANGNSGLRRIAIELESEGILSPSGKMFGYATLYNIIRNPKYKGFYAGRKYVTADYRNNKKIKQKPSEWLVFQDDDIPAIVEEALWDKANALLDERGAAFRGRERGYNSRYKFSGKIICTDHNTSYHRHVMKNKSGERECWSCRMYRLKGKVNGCDSPTIYSDELDIILASIFRDIAIDRKRITQGLLSYYRTKILKDNSGDNKAADEAVKAEIKVIKSKKDKLLELAVGSFITNDEFKKRNDNFNTQINKLERRLDFSAEQIRDKQQLEETLQKLEKTLQVAMDDKSIENEELTELLLDKIFITKSDENNTVTLDVVLKTGASFGFLRSAEIRKNNTETRNEDNSILLSEIGISQAQVSRLEKGALERIKKQL